MTIVSKDIEKAVAILKRDGVVAIPTETVYGLAANIHSEKAIRRIFEIKQRPLFNPLIVHLHAIDQVSEIAREFPPKAKLLADKFWPGPLTLVLKKQPGVLELITAGKDTVAIRIPNHPVTLELLRRLPFPLAAPSANPFNRISPTRSAHVEAYFKDTIEMVLEGGDCTRGIESTIIGFEAGEPVLYRLGSIAIGDIEKAVGKVQVRNQEENAPAAPGMLPKHYAPNTKTYLVDHAEKLLGELEGKKVGLLRLTGQLPPPKVAHIEILSKTGDLAEAAANLYQALHLLDALDLDVIIAERMPDEGLGKSINDRLERAAK